MTKRETNDELTTIREPVGFHGGNVKYSAEELASEARRVAYARKLVENYRKTGHL